MLEFYLLSEFVTVLSNVKDVIVLATVIMVGSQQISFTLIFVIFNVKIVNFLTAMNLIAIFTFRFAELL